MTEGSRNAPSAPPSPFGPGAGPRPLLTVLVASTNRGKIHELRALLAELPVEIVPASHVLRDHPGVIESGATFAENAILKAREIGQAAVMLTLADDSGLEVDALGGRPGVRSARFAKEGATDAENNGHLLAQLAHVDEPTQRSARFRCVLALYDPWNEASMIVTTEGTCEGSIAREPRGEAGFGYDPLFVVAELEKSPGDGPTMAELGVAEKNLLSHRARAMRAMIPTLRALVDARLAQVKRVFA